MKKVITIILAIAVKFSLTAQVSTFISNSENGSGIASETNYKQSNPDDKNKAPLNEAEGKTAISVSANPPIDAKTKSGSVKVKGTKGGSWNYTWRSNTGNIIEQHLNSGSVDSLINLEAGTYIVEISENLNNGNTGEIITQTVTINSNLNAEEAAALTTATPPATENLNNIKFTVFPNPNQGEFSVDITGLENNHEIALTLKNDKGETVYNSYFYTQDESSIQRKIVPETRLENGIYYCTISVQGIQHTVRVMVN